MIRGERGEEVKDPGHGRKTCAKGLKCDGRDSSWRELRARPQPAADLGAEGLGLFPKG